MNYIFDKNHLTFSHEDFKPEFNETSGFWRMFLDDGVYREITVNSWDQTPANVEEKENSTIITYDKIKANNKEYDITFKVTVTKTDDDALLFESDIINNSDVRVNEIKLPYFRFDTLGCDEDDEILYHTHALGGRIRNVRSYVEKRNHTEYMGADYHEISHNMQYPSDLNMPWFGLQAGEYLIYLGKHDEFMRITGLAIGRNPRNTKPWLSINCSQYPAVVKGEKIHYIGGILKIFKGDWRDGAKYYKAWSEKTWYKPVKQIDWVKNMHGWQRIILKHQYGEIFFKYSDLPKMYKDGAKYGIHTILVFGWWKGCFDNNYPEFEFDEELGGEEGFRKAIKEVQDMGGRILLYTNGNLIDIKTDYYKNLGHRLAAKDIDGNEYREHYRFSNEGSLLRRYGYKSFVTACHANEEWKENLVRVGKLKLSMNPDSIFYDQLSCCHKICFDKTHLHGNRIDEESHYRKVNIDAILDILPEGKALGTEWVCDRYTTACHYTHGYGVGNEYQKGSFPDIFRNTFPECIISNRLIHDEKEGYKKHLNYAFVHGLIFDIAPNRCRYITMDGYPEYSKHIKMLVDLKEKYIEFFRDGKFESAFDINRWDEVYSANYVYNGKKITAICNNEDEEVTVDVYGTKVTLKSEEVRIIEW